MRMLLPGVRVRRRVRGLLERFYDGGELAEFDAALRVLSEFYQVPPPVVEWYEYIDGGKTLGRTLSSGRICLVHPENWRKMRPLRRFKPTRSQWVGTALHEMHHLLHFVDDERKADLYARRFVTGLK